VRQMGPCLSEPFVCSCITAVVRALTSPTRSSSVVLCMMRVKDLMLSPPGICCTSFMLAYLHHGSSKTCPVTTKAQLLILLVGGLCLLHWQA
jgi:hypothetical protein